MINTQDPVGISRPLPLGREGFLLADPRQRSDD
jgi:hypothetical protein